MARNTSLGFQRKIVLPVAAMLGIVLFVFIFAFQSFAAKRVSLRMEQAAQQVRGAWQGLQDENTRRLTWFSLETARDPGLQQAMRRRDAQALLATALPRYREFNRRFGISHWYFITPERRVLLRVHAPDLAGDEVSRLTLTDAAASGQPVTGLELGATATMTLRHVLPWRVNGELLGYIEMGTEVDWFDKQIKQMLGYEVASAVHKAYTTEQDFATGNKALGFSGSWNTYPDIALLNQTLKIMPGEIMLAWQRFARGENITAPDIRAEGHAWAGNFVALPDMTGRPVASVAFLLNMDAVNASRDLQLMGIVVSALIVSVLLTLLLAWRVRRIEVQMQAAQIAARENEQRFRDFASAASDWWFWETDAELRFSYFSPNAATVIGRPIGSMLGRRRHELVATLDGAEQEKWAEHLALLDRHEDFHQYEYRIALADGRHAWLSVSGVARFAADGHFLGYRGTGTNISERKAREEGKYISR